MKILFFGAKSYDIKSFDAYLDKEEYKDLDVVYIEPNLTPLRQQCWLPVMKPCVHS